MKLTPHLVFNGYAEEAANFYASVLNGKIENLHYYDGMPNVPENWKKKVIYLCFTFDGQTIEMCDAEPSTKTTFGNGYLLTLHCDSVEQIKTVYTQLSQGGKIECPLGETFFAKQYAQFNDRYGVQWILIIE